MCRGSRSLLAVTVSASTLISVAAHASPLCIKDRAAFALADDTVKWTMTIDPGADSFRDYAGRSWSYMQIFNVSVVSEPSNGRLAVVGSGFRYSAPAETRGTDKFTLLISGKNRHDAGTSTLEIEVNPQ